MAAAAAAAAGRTSAAAATPAIAAVGRRGPPRSSGLLGPPDPSGVWSLWEVHSRRAALGHAARSSRDAVAVVGWLGAVAVCCHRTAAAGRHQPRGRRLPSGPAVALLRGPGLVPAPVRCVGFFGAALQQHRPRWASSTAVSAEAEGGKGPGGAAPSNDPLAIYVVLRKDLGWPTGALINQACHACTAAVWEAREDEQAVLYMSEAEGQMVKYTLGVDGEDKLTKVAKKLTDAGVPFRLWIEQPEDVPVCLATWPRRRSELKKPLKGVSRF
uniref:peptidyl-tRNA hydrolase n=1 Tax=Pyrodinium bahamense TaxID=73915 RepID=A0A7S0A333_9DINO